MEEDNTSEAETSFSFLSSSEEKEVVKMQQPELEEYAGKTQKKDEVVNRFSFYEEEESETPTFIKIKKKRKYTEAEMKYMKAFVKKK